MRHNRMKKRRALAQPAVVSVPQADDELDVIHVGTVPPFRLSPLSALFTGISTR